MPKKSFIYVEFKYPNEPWIEYDRTQVPNWADVQLQRLKSEHPDAEHRKIKR